MRPRKTQIFIRDDDFGEDNGVYITAPYLSTWFVNNHLKNALITEDGCVVKDCNVLATRIVNNILDFYDQFEKNPDEVKIGCFRDMRATDEIAIDLKKRVILVERKLKPIEEFIIT